MSQLPYLYTVRWHSEWGWMRGLADLAPAGHLCSKLPRVLPQEVKAPLQHGTSSHLLPLCFMMAATMFARSRLHVVYMKKITSGAHAHTAAVRCGMPDTSPTHVTCPELIVPLNLGPPDPG